MRRWTADRTVNINGLRFRAVTGYKHPKDLRLEVLQEVGWRPVPMLVGAMLADFFGENEDVLYPPPAAGGRKYMGYLWDAYQTGWQSADARLRQERAAKEARDMEQPPIP